ncbi:hypothetical protein ACLOJK_038243 [Asimina triloba]
MLDPLESHSLVVATSCSLVVATSSPICPSTFGLVDAATSSHLTSTFQPRRRCCSSILDFIFINSYPTNSLLLLAKSFVDFLAITTSSLVDPPSPSLADVTSSSHLSSTS